MKKKLTFLVLALACLLAFTGCCFHKEWRSATCTDPKTCVECGETEGEALGHTWEDATCVAPKTCATCHLYEGEALGHSWVDATTEAPKTCTVCGETEGERIVTDERFTTAATAELQGSWTTAISMSGEMMGYTGMEETLTINFIMDLGNDGTLGMRYTVANEEEFMAGLESYLYDTMIAEFEAAGLTEEQADEAMVEAYGMDMDTFITATMSSMDLNAVFAAMNINLVYYVEGDQLYVGLTWDTEMEPTAFTLEGDTLTMMDDISGLGEESTVFTRVTD